MITRDELYNKLLYLIPNAKFSFWPNDGREKNYKDDNTNYFIIDNWCISWLKVNIQTCPCLEEIQKIDSVKLQQVTDKRIKEQRNNLYAQNINMIATYNLTKKFTPNLTFSDYIDSLENIKLQ